MKKGFYAILAALTVFALVITACPPDGGDGGGSTDDNTRLASIQIGSGPTFSTTGQNDKQATGQAFLSNRDNNDNPEITLNFAPAFNGKAKIAVNDEAFGEDYNADAKPRKTFANNDKLYVKMTAPSGKVQYYGFNVLIGQDASLRDVTFSYTYFIYPIIPWGQSGGGQPDTSKPPIGEQTDTISVDALGEGKAALTEFNAENQGKIQFRVNGDEFVTAAIANDPDATVTIRKGETGDFTAATTVPIKYEEGDALYVKVQAFEQSVAPKYYKIIIVLKKIVLIPYGTPSTVSAETPDAIWETKLWKQQKTAGIDFSDANLTEIDGWLPINRANPSEGTGWADLPDADKSFGRAKVMWDADGVWVYAQVWEKVVSPTGATSADSSYQNSSVELFVHESYPEVIPNNQGNVTSSTAQQQNGGQFRLGANGERFGAPSEVVDKFVAVGRSSAKKYASGMPAAPDNIKLNNLDSGYVVIFQAPWIFPDKYQLQDKKQLAIELQINATGGEGTRVGVLNWNNISSNSYGSLADYGEARLLTYGKTIGAQRPNITTQPKGANVPVTATGLSELSVAASSVDGGTLSFQWYKAADATSAGTAVGTADAGTAGSGEAANVYTSKYTPADTGFAVDDEFFYYAEITNTVTGKPESKVKSNVAKFTIIDPNVAAQTIELVNSSHSMWSAADNAVVKTGNAGSYGFIAGFAIPGTFDITKYAKLEIRYVALKADGSATTPITVPNNTDIKINFIDGAGTSLNFAANGYEDYNASGIITEGGNFAGVYWDISRAIYQTIDFSGGSGGVNLSDKQGTNTDIGKYIIKSVKLVVTGE